MSNKRCPYTVQNDGKTYICVGPVYSDGSHRHKFYEQAEGAAPPPKMTREQIEERRRSRMLKGGG